MLLKRILFIHTINSKIKNNSDKIASTITYTIILELKTTLTRAIKVTIYNKHGNMDEKKKIITETIITATTTATA